MEAIETASALVSGEVIRRFFIHPDVRAKLPCAGRGSAAGEQLLGIPVVDNPYALVEYVVAEMADGSYLRYDTADFIALFTGDGGGRE